MRKFLCFLLLFATGCSPNFSVDEFELLMFEGINAYAATLDVTKTINPIIPKCPCGGTGRTGDGLHQCECGPNCPCGKVEVENITERTVQMYIFGASWCGPCQEMEQKEFPLLEAKGWLFGLLGDKTAHLIKIDIDEHKDLAEQYGVGNIPTFLVFRDGKLVGRKVGKMSANQIGKFYNKYVRK